ncbi:immunoglobulin superfamily member 5 isoform X2 [Emydura macquarii macquarii]|uniref:immunoglobulin superfamily member 5 isoform X2 n=1 Tax=Emydura macquarii macquarii TaxID=1129001 RepID=UPI003529F48F
MDSLQKFIPVIFILFASLTGFGFGYSVVNGPANATVLAGSVARFNCTVSKGWRIIIWLLKGNPVLTTQNPGGAIVTISRITQQNYTSGDDFISELIIHNVQQNDSGKIECSIQTSDPVSYAFLSVQVNGSLFIKDHNLTVRKNETIEMVCEASGWAPAPNMTWMVNNSFVDKSRYVTNHSQGSNDLHDEVSTLTWTPMANETLTCLAYIEALPKPQNATVTLIVHDSLEESTYQKELRKVSTKKTNDGSVKTGKSSGIENSGYSPEDSAYTKQMPKIVSLPPMASSFYRSEQDLEVSSTSEVPYKVQHSKVSSQRPADYPVNPRKIRNVTLV